MTKSNQVYVLLVHELSNRKKVMNDVSEAEQFSDNERNGFQFEAVFKTIKELNEYYNEYFK